MKPGLLITGIPRSGTTLLYCMLRYTIDGYRFHNSERGGISPGHITKLPKAVFGISNPSRTIAVIRDPKAVLTSVHKAEKFDGKGYFVSAHSCVNDTRGLCEYWQAIKKHKPHLVRYEDLISRPREIQAELGTVFGLPYKPGRWFDEFYKEPHGSGWETAMNGLRPLKRRDLRKHAARIHQQFSAYPELYEVAAEMGY